MLIRILPSSKRKYLAADAPPIPPPIITTCAALLAKAALDTPNKPVLAKAAAPKREIS